MTRHRFQRRLALLFAALLAAAGLQVVTASPAFAACNYVPNAMAWFKGSNCTVQYTTGMTHTPVGACHSFHSAPYLGWANNIESFMNGTLTTWMMFTGPGCTGSEYYISPGQGASSLPAPWNNNWESYVRL